MCRRRQDGEGDNASGGNVGLAGERRGGEPVWTEEYSSFAGRGEETRDKKLGMLVPGH